jgi:hypothetical protein
LPTAGLHWLPRFDDVPHTKYVPFGIVTDLQASLGPAQAPPSLSHIG